MIRIIEWDPTYQQAWYNLGYQWLDSYDLIEEEDLRILRDPEGAILAPGGTIFLALEGTELAGTLSLIPAGEKTYELAKMGVAPAFRRRGAADALMDKAHLWACAHGAEKLVLFTNRKLEAAQVLYDKWGFAEIYAPDDKFLLSDKQMEKPLVSCAYCVMDTPIGLIGMEERMGALVRIHLPASETACIAPETPLLQKAVLQMAEYFSGKRQRFSLPVRPEGCTEFQQQVLDVLYRQVSFGKTITYGQLAALSGYPGAARAVGHAMQKNPLCILIPCHRVLPASGGVGQYSAGKGSETKSTLLVLEQAFFHL